ncbi:hypothetical protein HJ167_19880 [Vibrio parahaemolyticus]|uniref:hypothetical protein n=1 Tax=Vibrio parahaemolyticus TaxID=670 RepID=UPI0031CCA6CB|nr:hypothetical protein [Vibrio parahaemolyticus]MDG3410318.1 hypothetical protein [Vibrio parahaemolyticus]
MFGFVQLINKNTKEVLQQRIGSKEHLEYYSEKVWVVNDSQEIVFVNETSVAQPFKFMRPVPKDEVIHVFSDLLETEMPKDNEATWIGKASDLEAMEFSGHDVAGDTWNAFTQKGEWVGTSEY